MKIKKCNLKEDHTLKSICKFSLPNFDDINICKTKNLIILQKSKVKLRINPKGKCKSQLPLYRPYKTILYIRNGI